MLMKPEGATLEYVSVNLSRVQLRDPSLVEKIREALREHGIRPEQLQLEITESQIMVDVDSAGKVIEQLSQLGVRLAMDDFGTGHSSLACLHRFPFDIVKIDKAFISDIEKNRRTYVALIHAVISLAENLGMACVAEGVETEEQALTLLGMECRYGQGYYHGKPARAQRMLQEWTQRPRRQPGQQPSRSLTRRRLSRRRHTPPRRSGWPTRRRAGRRTGSARNARPRAPRTSPRALW